MLKHRCPHCENADLTWVPADEPWHDDQWQCPSCDSTYCGWEYDKEPRTSLGVEKVEYEWLIIGNDNEILASKKPNEDPVFNNAEKAVLEMVKCLKTMQNVNKNTSNLLSDLSRLIV